MGLQPALVGIDGRSRRWQVRRVGGAPDDRDPDDAIESSLRLAVQDVALSRRKQGFESPRERQNLALTPIQSLYVAGGMVGGLFYFNYPGGTGLIPGSVFACTAATVAARSALDGIAG